MAASSRLNVPWTLTSISAFAVFLAGGQVDHRVAVRDQVLDQAGIGHVALDFLDARHADAVAMARAPGPGSRPAARLRTAARPACRWPRSPTRVEWMSMDMAMTILL